MPKSEDDYRDLVDHYTDRMGWSDFSTIAVLLRFIAIHGNYQEFAAFLQSQAEEEERYAHDG